MHKYIELLTWWQLPLTAIGSDLVLFIAGMVTFCSALGIAYYIIHRL